MNTYPLKESAFMRTSILVLFLLNVVVLSTAQTIKVCYKSGVGGYSINNGYRLDFDDKLSNPLNFGPSGTSKYTFQLYDFGTTPITYTALVSNGCQIFDAGLVEADAGGSLTSYTASEATSLYTWSTDSNKGVLLGFQSWAGYWVSGHTIVGTGNVNPNSFTMLGQKIFNGPFGVANSFNQGGGYQGVFTAVPSTSCSIIQSANAQVAGVINSTSSDVYLADVDMVSTLGGMSTGSAVSNNQDIFAMNLYHGLAKLATYKPNNVCTFFACNAGTDAPNFGSTNSITNSCPVETVNLTTLTASNIPSGSQVTWHTSLPATNGNKIENPTTYAPSVSPSTVYAAFYDSNSGCYSGDGYVASNITVTINTCAAGAIDCSKTQIFKAPQAGIAAQHTLVATINVTQAGCFKPISVSGSGITLVTSPSTVCATTIGVQQFHIPIKYDGSSLGTMNFTVGNTGSCSANLTSAPKKAIVDTWTLDCVPTVAPSLK
ncbi:hypothetical protein [Flectobacillus roseus]|uniref:hypothetical protein n=1 Tax=Flectobacillus roseus TaxID=502259 RepID=UPI0024B763BD|nr:hypothetical protein [Flectobacillus roseus]MDI9872619.1 hypothetical protein [Flectobacillus roseus]